MLLFSEHNHVGIHGEPNDSSSPAIPTDAVNGLDEVAERQCLLLVIGSHGSTIAREALQALWGVDPTGIYGSERSPGMAVARIWKKVCWIKCSAAHRRQTKTAFGEVSFLCTISLETNSQMGRTDVAPTDAYVARADKRGIFTQTREASFPSCNALQQQPPQFLADVGGLQVFT